MDHKGTEEEITYPNIFFTIDNFEEVSFLAIRQSCIYCCFALLFYSPYAVLSLLTSTCIVDFLYCSYKFWKLWLYCFNLL